MACVELRSMAVISSATAARAATSRPSARSAAVLRRTPAKAFCSSVRKPFDRQTARRQLQVVAAADASASASPASALEVTDKTFDEEVKNSPVPVLVDFWAPWCGPCRMLAPLIDQIAEEYGDRLKTVKLNTDQSPKVATDYGIRSIPTVMIFKGGEKMETVIGAVPKATLLATINKFVD